MAVLCLQRKIPLKKPRVAPEYDNNSLVQVCFADMVFLNHSLKADVVLTAITGLHFFSEKIQFSSIFILTLHWPLACLVIQFVYTVYENWSKIITENYFNKPDSFMLYGMFTQVITHTCAFSFSWRNIFWAFRMYIQWKLKFLKWRVKLITFFLYKQNQYKKLGAARIIPHW